MVYQLLVCQLFMVKTFDGRRVQVELLQEEQVLVVAFHSHAIPRSTIGKWTHIGRLFSR